MSEAESQPKIPETLVKTGAITTAGGDVLIAGRDINIQYARDEYVELQTALQAVIARQKEKQARLLLASDESPEQPYRYRDYFDLQHRKVFFGRAAAQAALLEKIDQGKLTLLHAPPGRARPPCCAPVCKPP